MNLVNLTCVFVPLLILKMADANMSQDKNKEVESTLQQKSKPTGSKDSQYSDISEAEPGTSKDMGAERKSVKSKSAKSNLDKGKDTSSKTSKRARASPSSYSSDR